MYLSQYKQQYPTQQRLANLPVGALATMGLVGAMLGGVVTASGWAGASAVKPTSTSGSRVTARATLDSAVFRSSRGEGLLMALRYRCFAGR